MLFLTSLGLIEIGGGSIQSSTLAFGANQLHKGESEIRPDLKEKYFSWYYAAFGASALVSTTCIIYIQDHFGWGSGYGVSALIVLCGGVLFFMASPLYVKLKIKSNLLTDFVQVIVACYRNWDLKLSDEMECNWYTKNGESSIRPSRSLRFLNKGCVIRDPEQDLTLDGKAKNQWKLCTVQQVEELKSLIRLIPMCSTGVIMNVTKCQNTSQLLQAQSMDRLITSNFSIPAASFGMFAIIAALLWIPFYGGLIIPLASKFRGSPIHINAKTRIGIGLFLSILCMIVTSFVESIRRHIAIKEGLASNPQGTVPMSALWVIPQSIHPTEHPRWILRSCELNRPERVLLFRATQEYVKPCIRLDCIVILFWKLSS